MRHHKLALTSSRVVLPDGIRPATVLVEEERIVGVVPSSAIPDGYTVEDFDDLVIMPGLVDSHVHINEPGRTEWEGFETATKAAAAGGITTLVDMPLNSSPVTTTARAFKEKLSAAQGKLWVDCGFHAGLIPGNAGEIELLIEAGVLGVKAFLVHSGIDDFPNATEADLRAAMPTIRKHGIPLLVHAELEKQISSIKSQNTNKSEISPADAGSQRGGTRLENPKSETDPESIGPKPYTLNPQFYSYYLASRPRKWEHDANDLMIRLSREYGCRVHIVHLASADAVPMLEQARQSGLPLTVETCPHYLYFSAEEIPDGDTRYKCAPPIRENENRERLWRALKDGVIDFIVSDHSPCPPDMKLPDSGDFMKAWGGIASLQFGLSIVWTEARKRGFSFLNIAEWMSRRPAELVGLKGKKGNIASGYDADFVVWNPDATFTVTKDAILHRHKVTPYEGTKLFGKVEGTYVRGRKVFDGKSTRGPFGQTILR